MLLTCPLWGPCWTGAGIPRILFSNIFPRLPFQQPLLSLTAGWPLSLLGWTGSGRSKSHSPALEQPPDWWGQEGGWGAREGITPPPLPPGSHSKGPASASCKLPLPSVCSHPGSSQAVWLAWKFLVASAQKCPFRHHITQTLWIGS